MSTLGASSVSSVEAASDLFGGEAQASTKLRRRLEHVARWPSGGSGLRDGRECGFSAIPGGDGTLALNGAEKYVRRAIVLIKSGFLSCCFYFSYSLAQPRH